MDHVLNVNEGGMDKKARRAITKDLNIKSVKTNVCGRHVLNQDHGVHKLFFENIEEYWANGKRVSRGDIFRTVLGIDPSFNVSEGFKGVGSREQLQQLKQRFYFGFKRRR